MRAASGLRGRLALAFAAVALLSTVLTAGGAALLTVTAAEHRALDALQRQADVVAGTLGPGGGEAAPARAFLLRNGRTVRAGPRSAFAQAIARRPPGAARGRLDTGKRELLYVRVTPAGSAPVVLARAPGNADPDLSPFARALVIAALVAALVAAGAGLLLATRLARPLRALGDAARRLGAGERGTRVDAARGDELGELGRSFNAMSAELDDARAAQERFLRSVSHELKTPLAALRAQGEALADGALPAETAGPVVVREAVRLERLVGELLTLGELDRPGFRAADEPVDLVAVADAVCARHAARARELGVVLERAGEPPAAARGDAGRLEQALTNLVENALRATPRGGTIAIAVEPAHISVSDTGPGIPEADLPRAFERFYLHDRHGSGGGGSGLGLALVAELCEAMGARASAARAPGGGARFTIELRAATPSEARR